MTGDEFVSITRGLAKRGWTDIEPKIAAVFASGGAFGILTTILASYHVPITPAVLQWGPYLVGVIGGYVFPSSGHIITTRTSPDQRTTTTKTSGSVETIVTGAVPVQLPKQAPDVPLSSLLKPTSIPNDQPTAIYPPATPLGDR
jgi:hypothetical protein